MIYFNIVLDAKPIAIYDHGIGALQKTSPGTTEMELHSGDSAVQSQSALRSA